MFKKLLAASSIPLAPSGGFQGIGNSDFSKGSGEPIPLFVKFISTVIGVITIVGILWFIIIVFTGAIAWIGAGHDKNKVESARQKISTGLIGLIVLVTAIFLISLAGKILGIENILDLGKLFGSLVE